MNPFPLNRFQLIAKRYWQSFALAILSLLVLFQLYSWGSVYVELAKVDSLIAQTSNPNSSPNAKDGESNAKDSKVNAKKEMKNPSNNPSNKPGMHPEGKGMPPGVPGMGGPGMGGPEMGGPGMSGPGMPPGGPQGQKPPRKPARNIFKEMPMNYQFTGIFMDKAVINNQYIAVGGKIGNATVTAIGVDTVTLMEDGKNQPRILNLFQPGEGGGAPPPGGPQPSMPNAKRPSGPSKTSVNVDVSFSAPPPDQALKKSMRERFESMSPQEREQLQQKMQNMSPQERQQVFEKMRNGG
ncbi:MAG: hypothetical protein AB1656_15245 [Candidatus Omnitrophota bacterium]